MIDSHAHLYLAQTDLKTLVTRAKKAGVTGIVNVGINLETSLKALEQQDEYPEFIRASIGIHPGETQDLDKLDQIKTLAQSKPYVAMGEMGLDYYKMYAEKEVQWNCFEAQMEVADMLGMPVIIHNRQADNDIRAITSQFPKVVKVLHCFASPWEFAQSMISDTTYFSFTGQITYAKKGKTINTIRQLPLDKIMIETDTPYLTPKAQKGKRNEPGYVGEILDHIIHVRTEEAETITQTIKRTTEKFFSFNTPIAE